MDCEGNKLSKMKKVDCTYFGTFALDQQEKIFSWGSGFLGHGNEESLQKLPKEVTVNV